jgi:hypothetical protein
MTQIPKYIKEQIDYLEEKCDELEHSDMHTRSLIYDEITRLRCRYDN